MRFVPIFVNVHRGQQDEGRGPVALRGHPGQAQHQGKASRLISGDRDTRLPEGVKVARSTTISTALTSDEP